MALPSSRTAPLRPRSPCMPMRPSAVTQGVRTLCLAFALAASGTAIAQTNPPASAAASYDIPAGALGPALSR